MFAIKPVGLEVCFPDRFKGNNILITGAATGIGAATAYRAALEGANVVCVDRKEKELEKTVTKIKEKGHQAIAVVADVSQTDDTDRMVEAAVNEFGSLNLVLNAAGVMDGSDPAAPFDYERDKHLMPNNIHNASDEYWDKVMANNATGMFKSLRAELRQMVKQGHGGAIVNIGSIAGITGLPGNPAYVASKHTVTGLTRSAAIDYAEYGIRINSVNMAQTDTPMVERAYQFVQAVEKEGKGSSMASAKSESILQMNDPQHRGAKSEEQAATILYLLSDDASNMTGAVIATDGGWTTY